mgnify:CR=1 FL=1
MVGYTGHLVAPFVIVGIEPHRARITQRGVDDVLAAAVQPRVEHLEAGVAQAEREHLDTAVMAIEAGFGEEDADGFHLSVRS